MHWIAVGRIAVSCVIALPMALAVGLPTAGAKNGDTHITGQGVERTLDCNNATLFVTGTGNHINAMGTCWAVTVQGSSNVSSPRTSSTTSRCTATTRRCSTRTDSPP